MVIMTKINPVMRGSLCNMVVFSVGRDKTVGYLCYVRRLPYFVAVTLLMIALGYRITATKCDNRK